MREEASRSNTIMTERERELEREWQDALAEYDAYAGDAAAKLAQALGEAPVAVLSAGNGTFTLWGAAFWSGNVL